jgi:Protein of unknown function (DUF2490)
MKKILIWLLVLTISPAIIADDDTSLWVSNTFQTDFGGSHYVGFLELQPRFNNDIGKFNQLIIRPFFGYKLTKEWVGSIGFAWQGEYNSKDKFDMATKDIIEQLQYGNNLTPELNFQYRFRLEQRFFEDADLSHRMRHRFRFQYSFPESRFFMVAFDELFVYFNSVNSGRLASSVQAGINQNRSYLGVGFKVTPHVNIDTGYQLQYVNNYGKDDLNNHVWLTNLNVNF